MKIAIESTDILTTIDGVPAQLWDGVTAGGIPCKVYLHRVAVRDDHDWPQFAAELQEQAKPAIRPAGLDPVT